MHYAQITSAFDSSCDSTPQETRASHSSANNLKTPLSSPSSISSGQKQYRNLAMTDVALPISSRTTINRSMNSCIGFRNSQNLSVALQAKLVSISQLTRKPSIGIAKNSATLDLSMYFPTRESRGDSATLASS